MCKLSLNVVPNVYNRLQSSFLSLAWPWSDRSLPQGNQWECWDPMWLGPSLPVTLMPLHHLLAPDASYIPACGSAGTLDWGPMWLGSQFPATPMLPTPPAYPQCPYTPAGPNSPWHHLTPCWPQHPPDTSYTPASGSAGTLDSGPIWLGSQSICHAPIPPIHPAGPSTHTPPASPQHPLMSPYPQWVPMPSDTLIPAGPWVLHSLPVPNAFLTPLHPLQAPWCPCHPTPLPLRVLGPWTVAQCGWAPTPPANPNAPLTPPTPPAIPNDPPHPSTSTGIWWSTLVLLQVSMTCHQPVNTIAMVVNSDTIVHVHGNYNLSTW